MAQEQVRIQLPEELWHTLGWPAEQVPARLKEIEVMHLLREDLITEAEAAGYLGLNRRELMRLMGLYRVPAIRLTPEELDQEVAGPGPKGL